MDPAVAGLAGVAVWVLFALVGGTRILRDPGGHVLLTFHLPFIAAAMILGGPIAGAWVALLGTIERRELREVPWYGTLANHAMLAFWALVGGLVMQGVLALAAATGTPTDGLVIRLVAGIAGTIVMAVGTAALTAVVVVLRDGLQARDAVTLLDTSFRRTAVAETLLGWLFVVVWVAVGWWAPALLAAVVLTLWRAAADARDLDRDDLTGVLSRGAFALRVANAAERARRGVEGSAYLFLDLDGFKALNDGPRNHLVGDQVLIAVGERLRRAVRVTDAVGRHGGDEFTVLFSGVADEATALALAERVHAALTAPYLTEDGERRIGASIGVALARAGPAGLRARPAPARGRGDVRGEGGGRRGPAVARAGERGCGPAGERGGRSAGVGVQEHQHVRRRARTARRPRRASRPPPSRAGDAASRTTATETTSPTTATFASEQHGQQPEPGERRGDRVRLGRRPVLHQEPHERDRVRRLGDADAQQDGRRDVGDAEGPHGTSMMDQTLRRRRRARPSGTIDASTTRAHGW